ncbi:hypothetical protein H0H81_006501 [Sphagnurus paluster]|uniref:Protein SQS1 n=1 Tax=Sphagnurus paluster TaxID=117069 RepID=A0A9P7FXY7_9AGAR|nr:hypothetical protein H0H81_006501 [Sphagnurus paluster]
MDRLGDEGEASIPIMDLEQTPQRQGDEEDSTDISLPEEVERPLLRPVIFVPSVLTKTLFQEEEEIFKAIVEDVGEEENSHVPTADRVFRVFSGRAVAPIFDLDDDEELEEIDFNEIGKILDAPTREVQEVNVVEEKFSGIFRDSVHQDMVIDEYLELTESPSKHHEIAPLVIEDVGLLQSNQLGVEQTPDLFTTTHETETLFPTHDAIVKFGNFSCSTDSQRIADLTTSSENTSAPASDLPAESLVEEFKGFFIDTEPTSKEGAQASVTEQFTGFYIDTEPSGFAAPHEGPAPQVDGEDDEIIVYVAPHPRTGRVAPPVSAPSLSTTSILTGTTTFRVPSPEAPVTPKTHLPHAHPPAPDFASVSFAFSTTPKKGRQFVSGASKKAALRQRRQEARATRRRAGGVALFGSFGAIREEAQLHGGRDPRWDERRRGDSDVDWGSELDDSGGDGLAEGMELDPDLDDGDGGSAALRQFVKSMGHDGGRFVTMDDIADGEIMRMEDEANGEERDVGSSGDEEEDEVTDEEAEENAILHAEEEVLMGECADMDLDLEDDSDEDGSDDEGNSPRTGFQARLERLRNRTRGKGKGKQPQPVKMSDSDDDDNEDILLDRWAEDEDFIDEIQMLLDENEDILMGRDRKARNKLFRAVRNGDFEDLEEFKPAPKRKDGYKNLPPDLQAQWQKDRDKKAENKRARALARMALAADPMSSKKGGKKGRKAMLAAAKLDPTIMVLPNRIIDVTTLVQQIRRFIADVGGPQTMSLPPTDKATRKNVHELALAFNLNSISKGKGDARYTTLTKTTRTGLFVDENKAAKIMRRGGGGGGGSGKRGEFMGSNGRGGGGKPMMPRHKEGEEVGKAAPKIGESNLGFKMLAMMGWSEGQRIGVTGGLDVPLTAVIKNTKLGLGATR